MRQRPQAFHARVPLRTRTQPSLPFPLRNFLFPVPNALCYRFRVSAPVNNPSPQFGTAEYVGVQGNNYCQYCHQPVTGTYYRVHDSMACPACAEKVRAELAKDTHAAYMRALLFGIGAAIVGMILYATFEIMTGLIIGYVSLAVGWMVGTAMKKGSSGVGGRRYQITAALLTYAAVSMAAVPIWIHYALEHRQAQTQQEQTKSQLADEQKQLQNESGQQSQNTTPSESPAPDPQSEPSSRLQALGHLALLGIASPIVEIWDSGPNFGWAIGIFILFIGIRIAWRLTAGVRVVVYGPFDTPAPPTR